MTQQIINAVALGSIYALFTLGLSLAWGVLGVLNLAHGAIFASSAYFGYRFAVETKAGLVIVLPVAMIVGGLLATSLEVLAFRPIRRRAANEHKAALGMLIASVGASAILVTIVENDLKTEAVRLPDTVLRVSAYHLGSNTFTNLTVIEVLAAVVLTVALGLWVRGSHLGRALRALAYDADTTELLGINASGIALITMFVGGALAGGAGILLALDFSAVNAQLGEGLLLKAFAVVIVGGVGNVFGALIGGFLLAGVETLAVYNGYGRLRDAVAFVLVIIVLLVRPEGLFQRGKVEARLMIMVLARFDPGHFYDVHLTLIQATLVGMVLAASMQVSLRAGVFSLASVGTWGVGAYTAGIMARDHGANVIVSLASALVLSGAIGLVLAMVFVRLRGVYLAMATVAFDLVVIVIALDTDSLTGGPLGLPAVPPLLQMWQLILIVVAVACLLAWLERGHIGRTVATVGIDEEVAGALGIKVRSVQRRIFVLSALLGALAGGMNALLFGNVSTDQFGFGLVTLALTTAVIGGLRSWVGAYIGAVIIFWLPEVLRPIAEWRNAVYGGLLVLVISLEPGGFVGLVRAGWRMAGRRRAVVDPTST